jgi:predicted solute-binding protein
MNVDKKKKNSSTIITYTLNEPVQEVQVKKKKIKMNTNEHYHSNLLYKLIKQRNSHVKNKKKICSKFKKHKGQKFKIHK